MGAVKILLHHNQCNYPSFYNAWCNKPQNEVFQLKNAKVAIYTAKLFNTEKCTAIVARQNI